MKKNYSYTFFCLELYSQKTIIRLFGGTSFPEKYKKHVCSYLFVELCSLLPEKKQYRQMLFLYVSYNLIVCVFLNWVTKNKKMCACGEQILKWFSFLNCSFYVLLLENSIRTHLFLMQFVWGFAARKIIRKRF